jgi:TPR repeat protein
MSDPETTQPAKPEPSPDDTVRQSAGMPGDPHRTQPLNRDEYVNVDGTLKLTLADLAQRYDPTQEKALKLYEPPVQQQVPELAGETQKRALRPDAPQRLNGGFPMDPQSTVRMDLPKDLGPHNTQKLPVMEPETDPNQTQKMVKPQGGELPIRLQKVDQPAEAEGQTEQRPLRPQSRKPFGWRLILGLGGLVALGAVAYFVFTREPASQTAPSYLAGTPEASPVESVPPAAQVYFEQAQAGDAHAMRMLGAMYYYGLNVPRDREKGLFWYRMAAEKGSDAARTELSKLEGGR